MKFALVALLFCLGAASAHQNRLPLPKAIQALHPELLTEPLFSDAKDAKIVGGTNVVDGEAAHQIGLFRSGSFSCGGSFIAPNVVLTAGKATNSQTSLSKSHLTLICLFTHLAHCVDGSESRPSIFTIRYGSLKRESGTVINVKKVNKHPSYSSSTIDNDVTTLILSASFTPSTNAAVVQLTSSEPADNSQVRVTGKKEDAFLERGLASH